MLKRLIIGLALVCLAVLIVRSVPDIKRYVKIKRM
ncbi:MAG: DUF6893 family small protein [Actinomadura sp.]